MISYLSVSKSDFGSIISYSNCEITAIKAVLQCFIRTLFEYKECCPVVFSRELFEYICWTSILWTQDMNYELLFKTIKAKKVHLRRMQHHKLNPVQAKLLVKADFTGIQEFIFSIKSDGAARQLKGRSFAIRRWPSYYSMSSVASQVLNCCIMQVVTSISLFQMLRRQN